MTDGIEYIAAPAAAGGASDHGDLTGLADDDHPQYATDTDLTTHAAAADPHTGYVLESLYDAKGDLISASADNTPAKLTVGANDTALVADSAQAAGLKWAAIILQALADAKGDLIAASAADTFARLAVGANETVLVADSTAGTGLKWATAPTRTFTKPAFWNCEPVTTGIVVGAANFFRGCFLTIPVRMTYTTARIWVGTQSGNVSVGLYTQAGTTRLATTGAVACPAVGQANIAFTAGGTLDPGIYFLGVSADNNTAAFHGAFVGAIKGGAVTGTAHPAPTTVTVDDSSAGGVPTVGIY